MQTRWLTQDKAQAQKPDKAADTPAKDAPAKKQSWLSKAWDGVKHAYVDTVDYIHDSNWLRGGIGAAEGVAGDFLGVGGSLAAGGDDALDFLHGLAHGQSWGDITKEMATDSAMNLATDGLGNRAADAIFRPAEEAAAGSLREVASTGERAAADAVDHGTAVVHPTASAGDIEMVDMETGNIGHEATPAHAAPGV